MVRSKNAQQIDQIAHKLAAVSLQSTNPPGRQRRTPRGVQGSAPRLRGKGAYFADKGHSLGSSAGSHLGGSVGGAIGRTAGGLLDNFFGNGDYTLKSNSIMTTSNGVPMFTNAKKDPSDHSITLEHREFVCDITNTTAGSPFSIVGTYEIQPALSNPLYYASQLAANFEEWEPLGWVWCYESTSGSITTTQGLGTVIMSTQYDVNDPPFTSQVDMLDYEFSSSACPDTSFFHPVECAPKMNALSTRLYCRTGAAVGNPNLYDLGKTTIALAGVPAAPGVVLGKLWASYKIRLIKPKLNTSLLGGSIGYARFLPNGSGFDVNNPFGTTGYLCPSQNGTLYTTPTVTSIPPTIQGFNGNYALGRAIYIGNINQAGGSYRISYFIRGTGGTTSTFDLNAILNAATFRGCQRSTVFRFDQGLNYYFQISSVTATNAQVGFMFDIDINQSFNGLANAPASITFAASPFPAGSLPTGWNSADLQIVQLPTAPASI